MSDQEQLDPTTSDGEAPSKSERKRQMHALQALGESLVGLNDKQLRKMPLDNEELREAIGECRQIKSNSARKRQLQFIGKLMRRIDPKPIEHALQAIDQVQQEHNSAFHQLEQLREDMLAAGPSGVELAMTRWPQADRQQLRQLILQHQREIAQSKPPSASRKLFRYLKSLQENPAPGA